MLGIPQILTHNAIQWPRVCFVINSVIFDPFIIVSGTQCLLLLMFRYISQLANDSGKGDLKLNSGGGVGNAVWKAEWG